MGKEHPTAILLKPPLQLVGRFTMIRVRWDMGYASHSGTPTAKRSTSLNTPRPLARDRSNPTCATSLNTIPTVNPYIPVYNPSILATPTPPTRYHAPSRPPPPLTQSAILEERPQMDRLLNMMQRLLNDTAELKERVLFIETNVSMDTDMEPQSMDEDGVDLDAIDVTDQEHRTLQSYVTKTFRRACNVPGRNWPDPNLVQSNTIQSLSDTVAHQALVELENHEARPTALKRNIQFDLAFLEARHAHCSLDYDPFLFMQDEGKKYGFTISHTECEATIPTLWDAVKEFVRENPDLIAPDNAMGFLRDDNGETYNKCHFWSNFGIGDLDLWRGEVYSKFFAHLDFKGGFYYERWGDTPVHSISVALFVRKGQMVSRLSFSFSSIRSPSGVHHPPHLSRSFPSPPRPELPPEQHERDVGEVFLKVPSKLKGSVKEPALVLNFVIDLNATGKDKKVFELDVNGTLYVAKRAITVGIDLNTFLGNESLLRFNLVALWNTKCVLDGFYAAADGVSILDDIDTNLAVQETFLVEEVLSAECPPSVASGVSHELLKKAQDEFESRFEHTPGDHLRVLWLIQRRMGTICERWNLMDATKLPNPRNKFGTTVTALSHFFTESVTSSELLSHFQTSNGLLPNKVFGKIITDVIFQNDTGGIPRRTGDKGTTGVEMAGVEMALNAHICNRVCELLELDNDEGDKGQGGRRTSRTSPSKNAAHASAFSAPSSTCPPASMPSHALTPGRRERVEHRMHRRSDTAAHHPRSPGVYTTAGACRFASTNSYTIAALGICVP
ncbi:glycolipid 2-alpha-mannosyltransferase-domain-containing protein [Mycena sp. CBHHK59/15]|nr:glycolipid 2-alpha-mannosyltransferase-domain-containing protein [Mycena sp. CBHHK59/15]